MSAKARLSIPVATIPAQLLNNCRHPPGGDGIRWRGGGGHLAPAEESLAAGGGGGGQARTAAVRPAESRGHEERPGASSPPIMSLFTSSVSKLPSFQGFIPGSCTGPPGPARMLFPYHVIRLVL